MFYKRGGQLTAGIELLLGGAAGQTSNESFDGIGVVEFIIATIATDRFTRIAYTLAKPRKPMMPSTVRLLIHPVVSSTEIKHVCIVEVQLIVVMVS